MAFLKSIILEEFILQEIVLDSGSWEDRGVRGFLSLNVEKEGKAVRASNRTFQTLEWGKEKFKCY